MACCRWDIGCAVSRHASLDAPVRAVFACSAKPFDVAREIVLANNPLERAVQHRGCAVLAMDGALAGAEQASRPAVQLSR